MGKILDRYIIKETAAPFFLSLMVLTVTAFLSKVIKLVELLTTHGLGFRFLFWFIASAMPAFLIYTIPISFLIALLIAFTRLSSDHEITAMKASGISLFTLMRPVIALTVAAFLFTLAFTLFVFPWGNLTLKRLLFEAAKTKLVSGIEEKTFYDRFKGVTLYVDRVSRLSGEMEGIFISEQTEGGAAAEAGDGREAGGGAGGGESSVFSAAKGVFVVPSEDDPSLYLRLTNGVIHRRSQRDGPSYHIVGFGTYLFELSIPEGEATSIVNKTNRELYPGELYARAVDVGASGGNAAPYIIDFHKRFALPASVFLFSLLAVPLGVQKVRTSRFSGFSVALGVVLAYYVLSTALEALGEAGSLNPVVSVWGSDIVFGAGSLYYFFLSAKDRALFQGTPPLARERGA